VPNPSIKSKGGVIAMAKSSSTLSTSVKLLMLRISVPQAFWAARAYCALIECITLGFLLWGGASVDAPPGGDSLLTRLTLMLFGAGLLLRLISVAYPTLLITCILTSLIEYAVMCWVNRGHGDLIFLASILVLIGGLLRHRDDKRSFDLSELSHPKL
jgi:hypothetical protein